MSRKGKAVARTVAAEAQTDGAKASVEWPAQPAAPSPFERAGVRLAAAAALFWTIALGVMGALTANPTLVSRDQLARADIVVEGRISAAGQDRLEIDRVLSGEALAGESLVVLNLNEAPGLSPGETFVVPLTRFRQNFLVTRLDGQQAPPLIYRAVPETIEQVKKILRESSR